VSPTVSPMAWHLVLPKEWQRVMEYEKASPKVSHLVWLME